MLPDPLGVADHPTAPLVYAHRGDRSRADDNTADAYALAVEAGADGIEVDIRRTVDGVLIVVHDPFHGELPPWSEMTHSDISAAEPTILTAAQMLATIPEGVFINVEIKNAPNEPGFDAGRSIVDATLAEIATLDDMSRILISSFDPECVGRARELAPDVKTGLLIAGVVAIDHGVEIALDLGADALHPPMTSLQVDPDREVRAIHEAGLAAVVWNANTRADVAAVARAAVDVIITDDPGMANHVLGQL